MIMQGTEKIPGIMREFEVFGDFCLRWVFDIGSLALFV